MWDSMNITLNKYFVLEFAFGDQNLDSAGLVPKLNLIYLTVNLPVDSVVHSSVIVMTFSHLK
jgi:hypothetical protein